MRGVHLWTALLLQLFVLCKGGVDLRSSLSRIVENFKPENEKCAVKTKHMLNQFLQDDANIAGLMNSGLGINKLGNYKECTNTPASRYILLTIENLPLIFNLGICGPAECLAADYDSLKKPVAGLMSAVMKSVKPKDSDINSEVKESDVQFVDSAAETENLTSSSVGAVLTVIMLAAFVIASVVATVVTLNKPGIAKSASAVDRLIYSFDIRRNAEALVHVDQKHDAGLKVFDGIRVLGMLWIILGHSAKTGIITPVENTDSIDHFVTDFSKAHLYNALLAVDIFFFLSGFLLCFVLISSIATRFTWKLYLHRLIRLYPALIVAFCVYCYILPLFAQGPRFYSLLRVINVDCKKQAADIFFFFFNFRDVDYECAGWVWYVSADMQFFVITPPIIYLLFKWPRAGLCVVLTLLVGAYVSTAVVASMFNIYASVGNYSKDYTRYYYGMPYARIPPYLIGVLVAYWYLQVKKKDQSISQALAGLVRDNVFVRIVCYIAGLAGVFFSIQAQHWLNRYYKTNPRWVDMTYLVGGRSFFIISLFVLCLPAMVGKGRVMSKLLASPLMSILAKLTYGVYMVHQALLEYYCYSRHTSTLLAYDAVWFWFCSLASMAYAAAFVLYLFIEAPIFNLEDTFLRVRGRRPVAAIAGKETAEERGLLAAKSGSVTTDSVVVNKDSVLHQQSE